MINSEELQSGALTDAVGEVPYGGGLLLLWIALAVFIGAAVGVLVTGALRNRKRRTKSRVKRAPAAKEESPSESEAAPSGSVLAANGGATPVEIACVQGIGLRDSQQDAYGFSDVERFEQNGLLAVMCDGMGGMAEGGRIADDTARALLGSCPEAGMEGFGEAVARQSAEIHRRFGGMGGTTLVAAYIRDGGLSFWCAGDSDLFLLRGGTLLSVNKRQEYMYELMLKALDGGAFPAEAAYSDPQAGALSQYIGKENVETEQSRRPLALMKGDVLMLCSDGVSDTLPLDDIRDAMMCPPRECCRMLEERIIAAEAPEQDNYTALVIGYNGESKQSAAVPEGGEPSSCCLSGGVFRGSTGLSSYDIICHIRADGSAEKLPQPVDLKAGEGLVMYTGELFAEPLELSTDLIKSRSAEEWLRYIILRHMERARTVDKGLSVEARMLWRQS